MSRCDFNKVAKQLYLIHTSGTDPFEGLRVPDEFYRFARTLFEWDISTQGRTSSVFM